MNALQPLDLVIADGYLDLAEVLALVMDVSFTDPVVTRVAFDGTQLIAHVRDR